MSWLHLLALGAAGLASIKAAIERGDLDEASRQGMLAGVVIVEQGLTSPDRATRLGSIAAAPTVEDRAELLETLAIAAAGPDRRTAIPAAHAARDLARELSRTDLADDLALADLSQWRDAWGALARADDRWIEVRVLALDTAAALDLALAINGGSPGGIGIDPALALGDPDPAFRTAAIANIAVPVPAPLRASLATLVIKDTSPEVALAAAQALCADLVADPPEPILAALGAPGLARLRSLVTTEGASPTAVRDASRCLAADKSGAPPPRKKRGR